MSEASGTFHCPACAAGFHWKPQYAGRKMRCKCGNVFVATEPAVELEEIASDEDEVVAAPSPAQRVARVEPPTPPGVVPASVAAMYMRKSSRFAAEQDNSEPEEGSNVKNIYVPLLLLALGIGLRVSQLIYTSGNRGNKWAGTTEVVAHPGKAVLLVLCEMVIGTGVMVCGAAVAAMLLNINFGPVAKAGLKLCATAVFATGVAGWVTVFDTDRFSITGMAVALHLVIIIYWIALAYFFSLELQETMLTVAIISLLQAAGMCALWRA
jgi:hypothetical protein